MKKVLDQNRLEWPTWVLILAVTALWCAIVIIQPFEPQIWNAALLIPLLVLHSSLQHEAIHILEQKWPRLARIAIFPAFGLFVPYLRFRELHLKHHINELITDPFDDPETMYLEAGFWRKLPLRLKRVFEINNTLIGRMIIGPIIGQVFFMVQDFRALKAGDLKVMIGWGLHIPAICLVLGFLILWEFSLVSYLLAAYGALSILKIRTFLEHRAHHATSARSVLIRRGGVFGFLFLNNNLHAVHHKYPGVSWYNLPKLSRQEMPQILSENENYQFRSYWEIFARFAFKSKEPVVHPIWNIENRNSK